MLLEFFLLNPIKLLRGLISMRSSVLFLFAHQDDEFGIFQKIVDERNRGRRVLCAYLTDGVCQGRSSFKRNSESLGVLTKLGVFEADIFFAGCTLSIPDGDLLHHIEIATDWVLNWITQRNDLTAIYLPAWEGGHHDHDTLHAIGVIIAHRIGRLDIVKQFPLYNAYRCWPPFFRVLRPLALNGAVEVTKIPLGNRIQFLQYCFSYPSQRKTWIGLLPFVLLHYVFSGVQALQAVSVERLYQRPHRGPLYYENRKFCTWDEISDRLKDAMKYL